jgi:hypothetical protein
MTKNLVPLTCCCPQRACSKHTTHHRRQLRQEVPLRRCGSPTVSKPPEWHPPLVVEKLLPGTSSASEVQFLKSTMTLMSLQHQSRLHQTSKCKILRRGLTGCVVSALLPITTAVSSMNGQSGYLLSAGSSMTSCTKPAKRRYNFRCKHTPLAEFAGNAVT